jgi:hypothetical protein
MFEVQNTSLLLLDKSCPEMLSCFVLPGLRGTKFGKGHVSSSFSAVLSIFLLKAKYRFSARIRGIVVLGSAQQLGFGVQDQALDWRSLTLPHLL